MTKPFIMVGLSGGVDSAVSAYLLKEQGYPIAGMFMKNWEEDDTEDFCSASQDREDAAAVCDILNIPFHTVNFAAEYWDNVFEHFLAEYRANRTPNPDILCNREIKFKAFLEYAKALGATHIATGHYAQIEKNNHLFNLKKAVDKNKDQTYFLHALNQSMLAQAIFPVGHLSKPQVRELAKKAKLPNFAKKDSTGICFIGERKFKSFLQQYLKPQIGNIVDTQQNIIGQHDGLMFYTLGQRQGLAIGGIKNAEEKPWYVYQKLAETNTLVVTQQETDLLATTLQCGDIHWISAQPPKYPFRCSAKIRYRHSDEACVIELTSEAIEPCFKVTFDQAQRAVTPGQSIVFYDQNTCLGGAIIL